MKKILVLLFGCSSLHSYALGQVKPVTNSPLFAFGRKEGQPAHFAESDLPMDSMRVLFNIDITFKYSLQDTGKDIVVQSVNIRSFTFQDWNRPPTDAIILHQENIRTEKERKFWERYSTYIKNWFSQLDFGVMLGIRDQPNPLPFMGVFILVRDNNPVQEKTPDLILDKNK